MKSFVPVAPAARLAPDASYELSGDWLTFHLGLQVLAPDRAAAQPWAVQLWATPLAGDAEPIKVAELALAPAETWGSAPSQATVPAWLPAGSAPCRWTLALVAGFPGLTDLHDSLELGMAPAPLQPSLDGGVTWAAEDGQARLHIEAIRNPRAADNLSGTLALEVWSLTQPYHGGSWWGVPVASVVLGQLSGQCVWTPVERQLSTAPLPATGHLTLMLREWTPSGYLTRDFRRLDAAPAVVAPVAAEAAAEAAVAAAVTDAPAAAEVAAVTQAAEAAAPAPAATAPAAPAPAPAVKASKVSKSRQRLSKATQASADSRVSLNRASVDELLGIKGIGPALAQAIIAARPLVSVDELARIKGLGGKLLDKIRAHVRL